MAKKNNPLSDVLGFVQKAATDAVNAAGSVGESVKDGIVSAANTVGSAVNDAASRVSSRTVKIADLNGDGKLDQEDVMIALGSIYTRAIDGIPGVSKPIETFSADYLKNAPNEKAAARKMLDNAIIKCTTSGFLTGFGGLITLPVTLPANITSVIYVQIRMIASVAYMAGLDVKSDAVQTLTYACLAGVSVAEVVKKTGMAFGTKMTMALVKKIPGKTLTKINQKVGFRFLTKFGEKGLINIGKMIPVVGALISGGFDLAETKIIADRAYKEFMEGQFVIEGVMDEIEDETDSTIVEE
ncbi:MAG: EcsC family protein [Paenibacillus sp.]|uniref:EcsC family protein n=1 Tax=Paenibacillus sp. TaxID=58172 RepID=UPI0025E968B3|nr:EcsC family protein [Paenibacillus sp.]MBR2563109.1 EcsC family protein [Paenibacillus sp.]